jgi:hypothetical protein
VHNDPDDDSGDQHSLDNRTAIDIGKLHCTRSMAVVCGGSVAEQASICPICCVHALVDTSWLSVWTVSRGDSLRRTGIRNIAVVDQLGQQPFGLFVCTRLVGNPLVQRLL